MSTYDACDYPSDYCVPFHGINEKCLITHTEVYHFVIFIFSLSFYLPIFSSIILGFKLVRNSTTYVYQLIQMS